MGGPGYGYINMGWYLLLVHFFWVGILIPRKPYYLIILTYFSLFSSHLTLLYSYWSSFHCACVHLIGFQELPVELHFRLLLYQCTV